MVKFASRTRVVEGSLLNGFGRAAEQAIVENFLRPLQRATEEFLHHTLTRMLAYVVAGTLLAGGTGFFLYGAAETLRSASLPKPAAYAAIGAAAFVGGLALLFVFRPKKKDT
jgi:hypothetical protein